MATLRWPPPKGLSRIVERYFGPNLSPEELRQTVLARTDDPLKDFSEACRHELRMLERRP